MSEEELHAHKEDQQPQGFVTQPTGMMEQVRLEGEDKTDFFNRLQAEREAWAREHPDQQPPQEQLDAILAAEAGVVQSSSDTGSTSGTETEPKKSQGVPMGKVSICRMVEYRSRTGNYSVPAVVNCTTDSIYQPGVEHGFVPPLDGPEYVHLTVFSPGKTGMRITQDETLGAEAFVVPSTAVALIDGERVPMPISENVAGCYQEWNIPYDPDASPGTWRWPTRV